MGCVPISAENCQAVEFVYTIETESLVCSQNMLKKMELAAKLLEKYKQLIIDIQLNIDIPLIPLNHFCEFGLKELMIKGYYNCKSRSAGGFMMKVKEVKMKVQATSRKMVGIGTPLSKIPSGKGMMLSNNSSLIDTRTKWDR